MKPMANKSANIKSVLEALFPGTAAAIEAGKCPTCKGEITGFRNALSQKEYMISGMCQKCQDSVFGAD